MTLSAQQPDLLRLHITPFNQAIFEKNIPTAVRNTAQNVSFHAVQTFPEKGFGYMEVTKADADVIKKKLNGTTLKGMKIRIEEARPTKRRTDDHAERTGEAAESIPKRKKARLNTKSTKRKDDTVIQGYELPADRHVKRGWTEETKSAGKKSSKTKATGSSVVERNVLFKTVVPANKKDLKDKDKDKAKERKERRTDKKTKATNDNEAVVREFQRSRNTFVVSSSTSAQQKPAVAYEDGLGWVDEDGELVGTEASQVKRRRALQVENAARQPETTSAVHQVFQPGQIVPESSLAGDVPHSEKDRADQGVDETASLSASSGESSSADDDSDEDSDADNDDEDMTASTADSREENADDAEDTTEVNGASASGEIHPLEALYKRPRRDDMPTTITLPPIDTSFSFFGGAADADGEDGGIMPEDDLTGGAPQTPHTKQDFEWRGQRSAAPTPDTAAIEGRFSFPFGPSDDDEDDGHAEADMSRSSALAEQGKADTSAAAAAGDEVKLESAFRKFFFEKRGDNDRAWKKKRREARKLQRQRENRRLTRRIV